MQLNRQREHKDLGRHGPGADPLEQCCSFINLLFFFSETWLKYKFWFSKSVTQLRFCFSNKLPGDASATDLWTTLLQESFREPQKP